MLNILFGIYLASTIIAILALMLVGIKCKFDFKKQREEMEARRAKKDKDMLENGLSEAGLRKIHEIFDWPGQKKPEHWIDKVFEFFKGIIYLFAGIICLFTPIFNTLFAIYLIFNYQDIVDKVVWDKLEENYVELMLSY